MTRPAKRPPDGPGGVDALLILGLSYGLCGPRATGRAFSFEEDTLLFYAPLRQLLADAAVRFWDPYLFCGFPLGSNPQAQLFYPLNLLYELLPVPLAYGLLMWGHLALGGLGIAFLLHTLGAGIRGRRLGALVFLFSTYWQAKITNAGMLAGCAWAGFALGGLTLALSGSPRRKHGVWTAAAALALSVMAGMPHPPLLIGLAMLLLAIEHYSRDRHPRETGKTFVTVIFLAALLSAVTWLPAVENLPRSNRGPLSAEEAYNGSLTIAEIPGASLWRTLSTRSHPSRTLGRHGGGVDDGADSGGGRVLRELAQALGVDGSWPFGLGHRRRAESLPRPYRAGHRSRRGQVQSAQSLPALAGAGVVRLCRDGSGPHPAVFERKNTLPVADRRPDGAGALPRCSPSRGPA